MTSAFAPRMPLLQPPYTPEVDAVIQSTAFTGMSQGKRRLALAQGPKLAKSFLAMARVVLFQCDVPERDREIAINRTGALTRSEYEWGMHVSLYGAKCKLGELQIHELTSCSSWKEMSDTVWTPAERLIVRMVDELHHHSTVSDNTWSELNAAWPKEQVMELVFASSFYHMAAFFLNTAAVPLEEGARRFPAAIKQAAA